MLKPFAYCAALAALALAACGGGSSGNPIPIQTNPPTSPPTTAPVVSQVHYSWQGTLAPSGATQTFSFSPTAATPSPIPVLATLCDPRTADCRPPDQQQYKGLDINPYLAVTDAATPGPSAAPAISPPPGISVALLNSASPTFNYQYNTPSQAGCADLGVTFSNANGKIRTCVYKVLTIGCVTALENQPGNGYSTAVSAGFSFDSDSYVSSPSQADIYMTGESGGACASGQPFHEQTAGPLEYKVYFPYGATAVSTTANSLATISPNLWTNTFTMITFNGQENQNGNFGCGAALNCVVIFKTHNGNIGEFQVSRLNSGGPGTDLVSGDGDWFTAAYATATAGSFPQ